MNIPNITGNVPENTTQENDELREKFNIKVDEVEEFPAVTESSIMSLYKIMEKVSELFSAAYKDYAGCYITPIPNGVGFDVRLFFKHVDVPQGLSEEEKKKFVKAFQIKNYDANNMGITQAYGIISSRNQQRVYEMTQQGMDGLEKFVHNSSKNKNGKVNWKDIVGEQTQNGINSTTFAVVTGLDIYKILSEIYGHKTPSGAYYQYLLNVNRPIGQNVGYSGGVNWLVTLQRMEMDKFNDLCKEVGIISTNGIAMV